MAPETKADDDSRGGKLKTYLKFNPDETVLALGNASVARWHAGRGSVMNGGFGCRPQRPRALWREGNW